MFGLHKLSFGLLCSVMSAILLWLAWPPEGMSFLAFIAFIPLFYLTIDSKLNQHTRNLLIFISLLLFHILAASWMYSSTFIASITAHLLYAGLMFCTFSFTAYLSKQSGKFNFPLLIIIWLSTEYMISHWEIAWPWFVLGNVFADSTSLIQWYSYTGTSGGTLWILICNYLIYSLLKALYKRQKTNIFIIISTISIVISTPIIISISIEKMRPDQEGDFMVGIVQPNINPLTEKFNGLNESEQIKRGLSLIDSVNQKGIQLLIFPETFITKPIDEDSLISSNSLKTLQQANDHIPIITGAFTNKVNNNLGERISSKTLYNSMIFMDQDQIKVYHKSRLLPLVEKQPFLWILRPFRKYIEKTGGYFGSYGSDNESIGFTLQDGTKLAPLICFESVFGEYSSEIVAESKASFIVLITNDGWWSSDGGYRQHLAYARLRCIETGRWMVRCANTGVSAVIDPKGNIIQQTEYEEAKLLKAAVGRHMGKESFYVRYGDLISKTSILLLAGWLFANARKILQMKIL